MLQLDVLHWSDQCCLRGFFCFVAPSLRGVIFRPGFPQNSSFFPPISSLGHMVWGRKLIWSQKKSVFLEFIKDEFFFSKTNRFACHSFFPFSSLGKKSIACPKKSKKFRYVTIRAWIYILKNQNYDFGAFFLIPN